MKIFRIFIQLCAFAYVIYHYWYAPAEGIYLADPVTLLLIGTGVGAAGEIQKGRVAGAEAKSAQNIANYNAAVMEQEAKAIRAKGSFEQVRQAKEAARVKSRLRTKIAGMGAIGSGLLEEEQAAELELEGFLIGYEAETAARRAESQAEIDRATGKLAKRRGKAARQASYIGAGATLLTGFGMAGMYGVGAKGAAGLGKISSPSSAISRYRLGGYGGGF